MRVTEAESIVVPGKGTTLRRGLTLACPACGQRKLFRRWILMIEDCPRCGLHFERIEGHWVGAIGINTVVSFTMLLVAIGAGLIATFPDVPVAMLVGVCVLVAVVGPLLFYPFSKTIWTAIDVAMRPLEAHEVDWSACRQEQTSSDDGSKSPG